MKTKRPFTTAQLIRLQAAFETVTEDRFRNAATSLFALSLYLSKMGLTHAGMKARTSAFRCVKIPLALRRAVESNFSGNEHNLALYAQANVEFLDLLQPAKG